MRCRKATDADIPQLKALWKAGFGDTDAEIDRFFDAAWPHCLGFCAEEEGQLLAALYALPQTLVLGERQEKAAYLYAVATAPAFRGKGICRALMAYAEKELRKKWFACALLVPGEPSLFGFYETLGYRAQYAHEIAAPQTPSKHGTAHPIELRAYAGLRETLLYAAPHVRYDAHWLSYAGTKFYALQLEGRTGCAAVRQSPNGACVCELLPDMTMLPALAAIPGQTPALVRAAGGATAFAMLKWLDTPRPELEPVYLAFAFE